jgi:Gram-negative bacterial TonB protein C-terminal
MDIGTLIRASDELSSSRTFHETAGGRESEGAELLELRTESGSVYACPSRWERFRLRWAFRHFHVLPPQVLSRAEQGLIEKLAHSAVVMPKLPVPQGRILGVVESVSPGPKAPGAQAALAKPSRPQPKAFPRSDAWQSDRPSQATHFFIDATADPAPLRSDLEFSRKARFTRDARSQQWGALGALAAVALFVILVRFFDPSLLRSAQANSAAVSAPVKQAAVRIEPGPIPEPAEVLTSVLVPTVRPKVQAWLPALESASIAEKTSPRPASLPVVPSTPARPANEVETVSAPSHITTSADPTRLYVSELPQGHFAEPTVTDPKLVGELRLRALIGSDGSVKEVTVVSGDAKLAEVGMRAVRRWRYQALDHPGEAETLIRMRFFGEDGVSIASVAK